MDIKLSSSTPQSNVAKFLEQARHVYLQEALSTAVRSIDFETLNHELLQVAPSEDLRLLASRGLRGELLFPVPILLRSKPNLLAYYRLLLGYSQKEFFHKCKLGVFRSMEDKGNLGQKAAEKLFPLCKALSERASELLHSIGLDRISTVFLHELTLLTLGPQIRGSSNTQIGKIANRTVFELIHGVAAHAVVEVTAAELKIRNASGRFVTISFSADPDISIQEELESARRRNIIAIEIKGGADQSNIWNRLGEAEKSHQSAKQRGFSQFWTIYNVPRLDLVKAHEKSPTTQKFFNLADLSVPTSLAFLEFREELFSLLGIPAPNGGEK